MAGVFDLPHAGRAPWREFLDLVGDDLWLAPQFEPGEIEIVDGPAVLVAVPRRVPDLARVLYRTSRRELEHCPGGADTRTRDTTYSAMRYLRRLACRGPRESFDAANDALLVAVLRIPCALTPAPRRARGPALGARLELEGSMR